AAIDGLLWDTAAWEPKKLLPLPVGAFFSSDGQRLLQIYASPSVRPHAGVSAWDPRTGQSLQRIQGWDWASVAPDGKTAATGDAPGGILLWDLRTGQQTRRIPDAGFLAFSRDGQTLALGQRDNT